MLAADTLIYNRYRVVRLIGEGGMGAVYEALDQRLRCRVALKQTLINDTRYTDAFEHEAQLLANLRHPALPKVIDYFTDADGQFLVMEYIAGDDLGALLTRLGKPFPVDTVLRWADLLLDALDYLHTQSPPIIHRDIKPQNLKLTPRGEIILLDFGLAKGSFALQSQVANARSIYGYTPQYAPLEQIKGTGTDARSDLYSIGATLYHLLTGGAPPSAVARATDVLDKLADPLRPAHDLNPDVPAAIGMLLMQAMTVEPRRRFASAAAMRTAMHACTEPQTFRVTAPATDPAGARTTAPAAPPATSPELTPPTLYGVPVQPTPDQLITRPEQQPTPDQVQPAGPSTNRTRWWLAGGALLLVILALLLGWRLIANRAADSASPSGTTKSTATRTATYPIALAAGGEARVRDDTYRILAAQLERYSSDKLALRMTVRLLHNGDSSINYWDDSFRLIVDGTAITPTKAPNTTVSAYSTVDGKVEFIIPETVGSVALQVGQVGRETNLIPLDLNARAAASPPATKAFQGVKFPLALESGEEIRAGDGIYQITSAQLNRYSTDQIALELEIHFTNSSQSTVNLWDDSFRVLIEGAPFAPIKAPNQAVSPQSEIDVTVVFAIPDTITSVELQVGQVGRQTNTTPITLKP